MKFFQMYKRELFTFFLLFFLSFFIIFCFSQFLLKQYRRNFFETQVNFINDMVLAYPELEYDIMKIYKNPSQNFSMDLLKKYGYTDDEHLSYLNYISSLETITNQSFFLSFLLLFFLIGGFVIYFYYQKYKRIQDVHDYLFRVLQNDYSVDLKDYQEDSISSLKSDLMKVTSKLRNISESSLRDKKNLERTLSDISHQLRTPLTSMYLINDILSSSKSKKSEVKKFLSQQKEQLERMEWLIVTLLKMSQIDSGTIVFQKTPECVKKIVLQALQPSLIPLELKNIQWDVDILDDLTCVCDFHWTIESLVNIIKNAMEHTLSGGCIHICANDNPLYVEILIQDNGIGIKKEDLSHIFERFYKGNTKSESIGIGLNLSKTIVEKQNGTIHVESKEGVGTTFIIHFFKVTV